MEQKIALIVDDDPDHLLVLAALLEAEHFAVLAAPNAEIALERIAQARVDLIVADWSLPRLKGPELIALVRRRPGYENIPAVLVAASDLRSPAAPSEGQNFVFCLKQDLKRSLPGLIRSLLK